MVIQWLCLQADFGSPEGTALAFQSQFGGQQAGLKLKIKCFPRSKEIRGIMWHSWSWLQERGIPLHAEVIVHWHDLKQPVNYVYVLYINDGLNWTDTVDPSIPKHTFWYSWETWKKYLSFFLFPWRLYAPSKERFLSSNPELRLLWMDSSCWPLAWMLAWLTDVWLAFSPTFLQLLIRPGLSFTSTQHWLLSLKVWLCSELNVIFLLHIIHISTFG